MVFKDVGVSCPTQSFPTVHRKCLNRGQSKVSGTWRGACGATYRICQVICKYARNAQGACKAVVAEPNQLFP